MHLFDNIKNRFVLLFRFSIEICVLFLFVVIFLRSIYKQAFHNYHWLTPYWYLPKLIGHLSKILLNYSTWYYRVLILYFCILYSYYFDKSLNQTYIYTLYFLSQWGICNKYLHVLQWFILSVIGWVVGLFLLVKSLPKLPFIIKQFVILALFPAYVTYGLVTYFYRVYNNMSLRYPIIKPLPSGKRFVLLVSEKLLETLYSHLLLRKTRFKLWNLFLETLTDNFYFLKKYYRLNDLIWQDGFLIDFLQKKVADRWVRTFIIYSGYLFSERFLFDFVVRFYIDFIIWPTYSNSLYEFNSISATLTLTILILMNLFLITSIYHFMLII